jgi:two-component system NarL family sensor kinase
VLETEMPRKKIRTDKTRNKPHASVSDASANRLRGYEQVVQNLEEIIVVVDRDCRYVMANQAYLDYRGVQREEIVGHLASEILDPQVLEGVIKPKLDECFQHNRVVKFELTTDSPRLGVRDLLISYFPICGPSGVERVASITQDITERKRANELIRQERDRAQLYLDVADVILRALDVRGRVTLINRKGCTSLGWEEAELLGRDWFETCIPAGIREQIRMCFRNLLAGDLTQIENPVLTRSGEERIFRWRNALLRDEGGAVIGVLSSGEDVTERKQAESALRHLSGRLLQTQDEERRKVARELHDGIGTYVSGLSLALGKMRTFLNEKNPEHQKIVTECRELIQAAAGEIRSISYLLHPPTMEEMGLGSSLEWLVRGFSGRSGITISLQLAEDIGRLKAEIELTLFRVTQEALNNVYRHSGSSTAAVRLFQESDEIVLEIADCGRGLPPRAAGADPDFTVGISGMRERVEELGGKFSIESVAGEGCTVRAAIPLGLRS